MDAASGSFIGPQPGPQTQFLASPADIAVYGGAAGGGKSWALLMEPLRHVSNRDFGAVFFRRTTVQVRNEGGLWDESMKLYPLLGASPKEHVLSWDFPGGASISFAHLEHDKTVLNWQGSQIPLICFDELTHFSEAQFWYMVSRNRSMCGVRPYIRATCNPDCDSWVASFIAWWIDPETGYPLPERAGVLRWFVRVNNTLFWADTPEELAEHRVVSEGGELVPIRPKSATFIPAKLSDNAELIRQDPGYLANLMALPVVERERLLGGNWKIRAVAGTFFKREWFKRYRPGDEPEHLRNYLTSDHAPTATDRSDPSTVRVWGLDEHKDIWLLGGFSHRATMDVTADRVVGNVNAHKAKRIDPAAPVYEGLIRRFDPFAWFPEDDNNWKTAAPFVMQRMREENVATRICAISPHGHDKAAKAQSAQGMAASGRVWIPYGSEGDAILDQLEGFHAGAEGHDEEVDNLAIICRVIHMAHEAIVPPGPAKEEPLRGIESMTFNELLESQRPKDEFV
jgi:predicted phage terminase large subunit-like protein